MVIKKLSVVLLNINNQKKKNVSLLHEMIYFTTSQITETMKKNALLLWQLQE